MKLILYITYAVLLDVQIGLLEKKRRTGAFVLALVSLTVAVILTAVFNALPGSGMMPGLTWFTEVIVSMIAAVVYAVMDVISLIVLFIRKKK